MNDQDFLNDYFDRYRKTIFSMEARGQIIRLKNHLLNLRSEGKKVIVAGNGGSAAIASHCSVDFSKNAKIRCLNFSDASLITCLSNDYGYERWLEKAIELFADPEDLVILISSSGESLNMIHAAEFALARGQRVVTFTGFSEANPLRKLGEINFWVNSRAYNIVEMTHQIWLLTVCDIIIGRIEYPASESLDVGLEDQSYPVQVSRPTAWNIPWDDPNQHRNPS